jgi:RNA polymerase sigma-B factor
MSPNQTSSTSIDDEFDSKDVNKLLSEYHKTKNKIIRDRIVGVSIALVKRIAYGLARRSTDPVDDLIQVGSIGLVKAIEQFDPSAGAKFHTYATHLITGEIRHYLRDKTSMIRAPRELQELSFRISRLVQDLIHELGREPTDSEVAEVLQIPADKISEAYEVDRRRTLVSLDQTLTTDGSSEQLLIDTLEDGSHQLKFGSEEDNIMLQAAIRQLKENLRQVVEMTYYQDLSQTEVARRLGISQMQVSRRLRAATAELQRILLGNKLNIQKKTK